MLKHKPQKKTSSKLYRKRPSCFHHDLSSEMKIKKQPTSQWNTIALEIQELKDKIVKISKTPNKRDQISMDILNHQSLSKNNQDKLFTKKSQKHIRKLKTEHRKMTLQTLSPTEKHPNHNGSCNFQDQCKIGQINLVFQSNGKISRRKTQNEVKELKKTIKGLNRQNKILEHRLFFENMEKEKLRKQLKEALKTKKEEPTPALAQKTNKLHSVSVHCKTDCHQNNNDISFAYSVSKKSTSGITCKENTPGQSTIKPKQHNYTNYSKVTEKSLEALSKNFDRFLQNDYKQQSSGSQNNVPNQSFLLEDFEITETLTSKASINSTKYQDATLKRNNRVRQHQNPSPFCSGFTQSVKNVRIAQLQAEFVKLIGQSYKHQNSKIKSEIRRQLAAIANQIRDLKNKDSKKRKN